jgi:DNA-directed RNA polymerase subunit RPC12/RpoP
MIKLRAELKCYLCGRLVGELEGIAGRGPRFQSFRPAPGMDSLLGLELKKARCPQCGGGLFVDEVERVYFMSERPLKPEKRGRKPRRRPAAIAS